MIFPELVSADKSGIWIFEHFSQSIDDLLDVRSIKFSANPNNKS